MKISELLSKLDYYLVLTKFNDHSFSRISFNSMTIDESGIFIAIKGSEDDGHKYINDVIKKGVKTVFVEREIVIDEDINVIYVHNTKKVLAKISAIMFNYPSEKVNVCGVTGTNGKTTVTNMLHYVLKKLNKRNLLIGTNGIFLNDDYLLSINTTPSAFELNSIINTAINLNVESVTMEVSSHAINQHRVSYINFDTLIFTNFSQDHLDYHKTLENYYLTKALLFVQSGYNNKKYSILNVDDLKFNDLENKTISNIVTYGIYNNANVRAKNINVTKYKSSFDLYINDKFINNITIKVIGTYNIYNVLAAISYFYVGNYDIDIITDILSDFTGVSGRIEKITNGKFDIFIDYAHTPDGIKNVLESIRKIYEKKVVTVFGVGGNRDRLKRPIIGKYVTELSDVAIITNDNPRDEEPANITRDIEKGIEKDNYIVIPDREQAIKFAIKLLKKGDVLLVLGKGHEKTQIINGKTYPFDDKIVIQETLKEI